MTKFMPDNSLSRLSFMTYRNLIYGRGHAIRIELNSIGRTLRDITSGRYTTDIFTVEVDLDESV
jgi:hypothetical protein